MIRTQARQLVADELRRRARRAPLADDTVLYESFHGNGMLCNPEALFRALLDDPDFAGLEHVWALTDLHRFADTVAEFADHDRVRFVVRGSTAYHRVLGTARYLVNNATFPAGFVKRPGQIYLNTWHGTPIKAMGYDVPNGAYAARNVVRNLAAADHLLAPNDETERMYVHAYRMTNIFRGRLLRTGTPRIDRQLAGPDAHAAIRQRLAVHGVRLGAGRVVLHAPTWRGDFDRPDDQIAELRAVIAAIGAASADADTVLLKVHQQTYDRVRDEPTLRAVLVPNAVATNDLLAVTDVLVTDYSSIWVDFLVTGRPIVFHAPDLAHYTATRGVNLLPAEWPGPITATTDELTTALAAAGRDGEWPTYARARARYTSREDGQGARRVIDVVFRGRDGAADAGIAVPVPGDGRTPILVHVGSLGTNGITSAALSLLATIDHDRFDVSAWYAETGRADQRYWRELIDPRVRLFVQPAGLTGSKVRVRLLAEAVRGPGRAQRRLVQGGAAMMREEWSRAFGDARFAHVVDFSAYDPYWAKLLAARPSGGMSMWLHNDIAAEMTNPGRPARLRARLRAVAALYAAADHLVSVSRTLAEVNRAALASWAPPERFTHARNTIDAARVRRLAAEPVADDERVTPASGPLFVTVGRLSPAKNQLRLIEAFRAVVAVEPRARLVVVGDGPLREELHAAVTAAGLEGAVALVGHRADPYPVLAQSDCFVLSSDYEGQPMVLLEALALGRPIVTTRFDTVDDALPPGCGLVVERSADALAEGMLRFVRGEVAPPHFDPDAYNLEVLREFEIAIGARPAEAPDGTAGTRSVSGT